MDKCCGNCSMANRWNDKNDILRCDCPLSGFFNTPVLKNESCERHRKATQEWGKYLESTVNCQEINDEKLKALAKGTDEAFKKAAINIEDAFFISAELANSGTELEEVICKHKVNGICELGIKTWCSNCKKQNWGKYEPREN